MNCRYIYDEDGLRWEETAAAVTLLVAGQPKHFRAVRNGSGLSRIARFVEKQQPHPTLADEYLYGEITEKDLGRIAEQGYIEVLLDGARVRIENTTTGMASFVAQIKTADGALTRALRAGKLGGSGRVDDSDKTLRLFARMNDETPGSGDAAALEQLTSMPKSARAGARAARARLQAVTEHLLGRSLVTQLLDGVAANPDTILHLTPTTYKAIVDSSPHGAERLEQAALHATDTTRSLATRQQVVLSACRVACETHTDTDRELIAKTLVEDGELGREALALLVRASNTRAFAAALIADAARLQPGRILTFETAYMLTSTVADAPQEPSTLDHLLASSPEVLAKSWTFLDAIGDKKERVLEQAPLLIATAQAAPKAVRDDAVNRLLKDLAGGDPTLAEATVQRIEDIHPEHAQTVLDAVRGVGIDARPEVLARLELARRVWDENRQETGEHRGHDDETRRRTLLAISELENGIRERMNDLQRAVSETTRVLLEASEEARRFAVSARLGHAHQRESVRLRAMLQDVTRQREFFQRTLVDTETAAAMFSDECGRVEREHGERTARRLGELTGALRYVVRETCEQIASVRCPDYLELETAHALAVRAETIAMETSSRMRAAAEHLLAASHDARRAVADKI